jgi:phosphohistidine phosphatase SixA
MPELILMRHAKAEPAGIDAADFARVLTPAGRAAAAQAAQRLAAAGVRVGRLLYSPARRTSETAAIAARELALAAIHMQEVPELYLATPAAIRGAVQRHHAGAATILIVGHNPSLSEFGGELDASLAGGQLHTAGVWRIPCDQPQWQALLRA